MKCSKCKKDSPNNCWESEKTYEGIDYHHNPPKFMMEEWKGKIILLCRECHKKLHQEITEIIRKHSNRKKGKSDYWLWLYVPNKDECVEEVIKFTERWGNDT